MDIEIQGSRSIRKAPSDGAKRLHNQVAAVRRANVFALSAKQRIRSDYTEVRGGHKTIHSRRRSDV